MTDADLDRSYTALCQALGEVGEEKAPLFLAMLSLAWMARAGAAQDVLPDIERIRQRCLSGSADPQ